MLDRNVHLFLREMSGWRPAIVPLLLFSFLLTLLFISPMVYMIQIHERVFQSRNYDSLAVLSAIMVIVVVSWSLLELLREQALHRISYSFDAEFAPRVFVALNRKGDSLSAANRGLLLQDVNVIRDFLAGGIIVVLFDLVWVPVVIAFAFLLHFWIGTAVTVITLAIAAFTLLSQLLVRSDIMHASGLAASATEFGRAILRSADAVRVMGMIPQMARRWSAIREEGLGWQENAVRRIAPISLVLRIQQHSFSATLVTIGALLVLTGEVGPGIMFGAAFIAGRTMGPVLAIANNWRVIWNAALSAGRLGELLHEAASQGRRVTLPEPNGALVVSRVSAGPANKDMLVVTDVSFAVEPGNIVGVVGASGAGKSSLGRVLVGAWPVASGSVTLDGHALSHWDQDKLGRYIGYVPQDVEMLPGTIGENISRFEEPGPETSALTLDAVNLANIKDIIVDLPNGLNTKVGPDGHQMSGGQRQRIALARAVYREPRLLVLDEPNSNLDTRGEQSLASTIHALRDRGSIVILITHRTNMLTHCDLVLVMNKGTVQAFGQRDHVVNRLAAYQPPSLLQDARAR